MTRQSFADWEMILVDDGSSDNSCEVILGQAAIDPRFRLIKKQPEGYPSRSRAVGLARAQGEYVAFCDHDDFWAPDKLALQVEAMNKFPDVAILHTDRVVWTQSLEPSVYPAFPGPVECVRQDPREVIYGGLRVVFSSFMTRRDLIAQVGFDPDMRGVDDMFLFYRLSELGAIYLIPLPLTYYYAHQGNLSHSSNIFVAGFYQVYEALRRCSASDIAQRSALAQAMRTEAVSLLATDRGRALTLLIKSLSTYFIPSTLNRLLFLVATWPVPLVWQKKLMIQVKRIKFMFPTFKDLLRSK
jgi:glycosyltransferase involved in cell wall biosynthesis